MMERRRQHKIAEMIKDVIASLIIKGFRDPRIGGLITVTRVEITPDLKLARVYVSILCASQKEKDDCFDGLKQALGYIKSHVSQELKLRFTPDLEFKLDPSLDYSEKINELLKGLKT